MYRVVLEHGGTEVAITDDLRYIKVGKNGSYITADKKSAVGVAVGGTAYNLCGHSDIRGADTVVVSEVDGGKLIAECRAAIEELKKQLAEMTTLDEGSLESNEIGRNILSLNDIQEDSEKVRPYDHIWDMYYDEFDDLDEQDFV